MTINKDSLEKKLSQIKEKIKSEDFRYIASETLQDGTIIEMLFDKSSNETSLAVCDCNGNITIKKSFHVLGATVKPYPPNKEILKNNVVLFPSEATDYASQKELIDEIQTFIHKYLSVSEFFEKIATYYVLFTWIYDDFNEIPYLRGLGDYGTGKSRLLQVIGSLCYRPIFASGATTVSPIFRILNDFRGTLVLDEADFKFSDTTVEMIKILNNGFMKGMPVLRSESNGGKSFDVKAYNVFSPKILASRMLFKDTALESRMITEDMNINVLRKDIEYNIPDTFWNEALQLRNKLLMFRFKNKGRCVLKKELENREIEPRLNQIALPLMSIVDDPLVINEIRNYIKEYNEKIKVDRTLENGYQILDAICQLLDDGWVRITIHQITEKYNYGLSLAESVTSKRMGYWIRKKLDLKTERTRDGYVLSDDNKAKLELLRKRYGIKDDREDVNIVNNTETEKAENHFQEKLLE